MLSFVRKFIYSEQDAGDIVLDKVFLIAPATELDVTDKDNNQLASAVVSVRARGDGIADQLWADSAGQVVVMGNGTSRLRLRPSSSLIQAPTTDFIQSLKSVTFATNQQSCQ